MADLTMTRKARRAAAGLLILTLITGAANLVATYQQVHSSARAQQRAGQLVERKLCTTFDKLGALKPPAGNPAANPSRAYLQAEHATLVQLGTDLGCEGPR